LKEVGLRRAIMQSLLWRSSHSVQCQPTLPSCLPYGFPWVSPNAFSTALTFYTVWDGGSLHARLPCFTEPNVITFLWQFVTVLELWISFPTRVTLHHRDAFYDGVPHPPPSSYLCTFAKSVVYKP
jgi:hypothetical protein